MRTPLKLLAIIIVSWGFLSAASIEPGLIDFLQKVEGNVSIPVWINWKKAPAAKELIKVENLGGRVRANLSWIPATSFFIPRSEIERVSSLNSVKSLDLVRKGVIREAKFNKGLERISDIDYGPSFEQMKTIGAVDAQREGFFGSGVVIGILDTGFDSTHPAVKHIWRAGNVLATYDFNSGDHLESPWGPIVLPFQSAGAKYIHSFDLALSDTMLVVTYSIAPEDSLGGSCLSNPWSLYYVKGVRSAQTVFWSNNSHPIVVSDSFATFPQSVVDGGRLFVVWQAARYLNDFDVFFARIDLQADSVEIPLDLSNDVSPSLRPEILKNGERLWVFWWDGDHGLTLRSSLDNGESFEEKRVIFPGLGISLGLEGAIKGDTLLVVFSYESENAEPYGNQDSVFVIGSFDGGETWSVLFSDQGFSPTIAYYPHYNPYWWIAWQRGSEIWTASTLPPFSDWQRFKIGEFNFPREPKFTIVAFEEIKVLVPLESGPILSFPVSVTGAPPDTVAGDFSDKIVSVDNFYVWRQRGDTDVTPDNYVPHSGGPGFHGTKMLSVIGGFYPGELVGPAPDAKFVLMKTEKVSTRLGMEFENQVEEDFWAEGLEWAAEKGAMIISSSLGYKDWYRKSDLNGRKSPASRAASLALERNILVVTAIGNRKVSVPFPDPVQGDTSLDAPSDAFDIIAVGGYELDSLGNWIPLAEWNFGPTFDGRMKPELIAPFLAYTATDAPGDGEFPIQFGYYTGTSYSTALVAGVAAEVWQAHPSWDAKKVREALLNTAVPVSLPDYPDAPIPNNVVGYGLVNAYDAIYYEKPETGPFGEDVILSPYPNPFRPDVNGEIKIPISLSHDTPATISIFTLSGERVQKIELSESESHVGSHIITWDGKNSDGKRVAPGTYLIVLTTAYGNSSVKKIAILR